MPEDPKQELLVALGGPAVNVVLAALLFAVLAAGRGVTAVTNSSMLGGDFLSRLMWVNVALAVFNLLPAFPMDGGRVLRALLATRLKYVRATRIAASIGQGMAVLFGFYALISTPPNPFLVFIALFVWMGAGQEAGMVEMKSALGGVPVERVMITHFRTLASDDPLSRGVEQILAGSQQDFPVVNNGDLVGVLTRHDLLTGLTKAGASASVGDFMQRQFRIAEPREMAEQVFMRLQDCSCRTVPVLEQGRLVGMVTMENVGEFMMIQTALQGERPSSPRFGAALSDGRAV
jgi:predicted transcriptional regulator